MNPRIIWNGNILDFPELASRFDPERGIVRAVNRAQSGKSETISLRFEDRMRIACEVLSRSQAEHLKFYRDLTAFWSWVARGNPFSFALDPTDTVDTTLNATLTPPAELVTNHNFDTWASDTDAGTWAETLDGAGGAINRVEDRSVVFSGPYGMLFTKGASGAQQVLQTITLAVSTKYRLRVRARNGTAGNKIVVRVRNTTTGNYLQANATWGAGNGLGFEPDFTPGTSDWTTFEIEFTTEGSGTSFSIGAFQYAAEFGNGELLYLDWFSILPKQKATLVSTDGVVVGNAYRIRGASDLDEEIVVVDAVDSATVVEIREPVKFSFASADIFRSVDYFPALEMDDVRQQPFGESAALRIDFDARVRNYVT